MAKDGSIQIDVFKKSFADVRKIQSDLDYWNKRIAKNDPFSAKNMKAAYSEIRRWNSEEEKKLKLLQKNALIISYLHKEEKKYREEVKTSNKLDVESHAEKTKNLKMYGTLRRQLTGGQSMLLDELDTGRGKARKLFKGLKGQQVEGEERGGILSDVAAFATKHIIAALVAGAAKAVFGGWSAAKAIQMYSAVAPNELGGVRYNLKGELEYSGMRNRYENEALRDRMRTGRMATLLQREGLDEEDVWNTAGQLRLSGMRMLGPHTAQEVGAVGAVLSQRGQASMGQMGSYLNVAAKGGNQYSERRIVSMAAQAAALGLTGGRVGEYMDSITSLMEAAQETATNTKDLDFMRVMARINATGNPALQGARGGRFAEALQSGLLNPGGGAAGRLLMLKLGGFGSGATYTQAQESLESGLPGKLDDIHKMFSASGNKEYNIQAFHALFPKISLQTARAFLYPDKTKQIHNIPANAGIEWLYNRQEEGLFSSDQARGAAQARGAGNQLLTYFKTLVSHTIGMSGAAKNAQKELERFVTAGALPGEGK